MACLFSLQHQNPEYGDREIDWRPTAHMEIMTTRKIVLHTQDMDFCVHEKHHLLGLRGLCI